MLGRSCLRRSWRGGGGGGRGRRIRGIDGGWTCICIDKGVQGRLDLGLYNTVVRKFKGMEVSIIGYVSCAVSYVAGERCVMLWNQYQSDD